MADRILIFISSPGDVAEERVPANKLVRRLADEYAGRAWIEPVFWEHEPLLATDTFQAQIPRPSECEIVVCILWSRLGTRLPGSITRPDGSRYASGTEYEFEDAVEGRTKNGYPNLLVYRKTAEPVASLRDTKALMERVAQKEALDAFIKRWFFDAADGTIKAAFHSFETSAQFEQVLEEHLRKLLSRRLPQEADAAARAAKPSWTSGSPFRGLDVFEFHHSPVYFGRTKAVGEILNCLREQAAKGPAFVLVTGISGGGKSSLVRAGVLPLLTQTGVIEGVGMWRRAVLRPSDAGGDLSRALAGALLRPDALPELGSDGIDMPELSRLLHDNPEAAFLLIKAGLSRAAAAAKSVDHTAESRLVVVVDQLEEMFTLDAVTDRDGERFVHALSTLARTGRVWVIATVRSDFYHRCSALPDLAALKAGRGQYDLLPPTPSEISQMIRQPAFAAGLSFERETHTDATLDETLLNAAIASPEGLPLLEFALEELYKRRSPGGVLTHQAYRSLGGVEGALARRAEEVFRSLHWGIQAMLTPVFRCLVTEGDGKALTRRQALLTEAAPVPPAEAFVEAFIRARLFTAGRLADGSSDGRAVVRVTNEALLRNWPRLRKRLEEEREQLRVRRRVTDAAARWAQEGRRADLLLGDGKPLAEAEALAAAASPEWLSGVDREFIRTSSSRSRRRRQIRWALWITSGTLGTTALVGFVSWGVFADATQSTAAYELRVVGPAPAGSPAAGTVLTGKKVPGKDANEESLDFIIPSLDAGGTVYYRRHDENSPQKWLPLAKVEGQK